MKLPPLPRPPQWTITGAEQLTQLCEWATNYAEAAREALRKDAERLRD